MWSALRATFIVTDRSARSRLSPRNSWNSAAHGLPFGLMCLVGALKVDMAVALMPVAIVAISKGDQSSA